MYQLMHQQLRDNIICRILSGKLMFKVNDKIYIVNQPDKIVRLHAQRIYNEAYESTIFEGWFTHERLKNLLMFYGLLEKDYKDKMKLMEQTIDNLKMNLYQNRADPVKCKDLTSRLGQLREKHNKLYGILHSLDHYTAEGYAEEVKNNYLLIKTLVDENENLIWCNESDVNIIFLQSIVFEINKHNISISDFREIARTEPWMSYWRISKGNPFDACPINWTEEQKTLVLFSQMYDNVYQHPDFPGEDVMNNDDMLDGWLLTVKKEQEKEKTKQKIQRKGDKHQKATEMFIPVSSAEEAKQIDDMNIPQNKLIKIKREQKIQKEGRVKEANLPDVKMKIFMDAQRLALESVRSRKKK